MISRNLLAEGINLINPVSKNAKKIQYFGPIKLKRAEVDTTGDGVLDTLYEYNYLEEIVKIYQVMHVNFEMREFFVWYVFEIITSSIWRRIKIWLGPLRLLLALKMMG